MNFIMKIMEKFLLWHHEDTILIDDPLEAEQHGFVKAKSCDSAITNIVSHVEYAMVRDDFAILALLDVAGAFDNADFCETLISFSKSRLSRKTLVSFSVSTLNFFKKILILILNSHSQTLKNMRV